MPDQKSGDDQKDPQRGTQNQKLLKMRKEDLDLLAEELGGEVIDLQEFNAAAALPAISRILKTGGALKGLRIPVRVPTVPHLPRAPKLPTPKTTPAPSPKPFPKPTPTEPAPKPAPTEPAPKPVPQPKPGKPTKPEKPGKPTKPETKPKAPTKPKDKGGVVVPGTDKGGKVEPKSQPIPSPKQTPQTKKTPPIVATPKTPGGPKGGPGGRLPRPRCTPLMKKLGLCGFEEPRREIGIVKARGIEK